MEPGSVSGLPNTIRAMVGAWLRFWLRSEWSSAPSPRLPTRSRSAADGRIADLDPISLRPVVGDRALGLSHVELADADYFARPPLQAVLRLRVPLRLNGPARLRPRFASASAPPIPRGSGGPTRSPGGAPRQAVLSHHVVVPLPIPMSQLARAVRAGLGCISVSNGSWRDRGIGHDGRVGPGRPNRHQACF